MVGNAMSSVNVVRKEEKQPALEAMILQDLQRRQTAPTSSFSGEDYLVVARSPNSPVVLALRALADQIAAAGITVYCIFSSATQPSDGLVEDETAQAPIFKSRQLSDARLLEAHESMRLNANVCWVGDCMRRDPSIFDAYEQFSVNCKTTSDKVKLSFDRFWTTARPLSFVPVSGHCDYNEMSLEGDLTARQDAASPKDVLFRGASQTRH
jgi:hypothetical protein